MYTYSSGFLEDPGESTMNAIENNETIVHILLTMI